MKWPLLLFVAALVGAEGYAHFPERALDSGVRADRVVVLKGERKLILMNGGRPLKEYRVALGWDSFGH